MRLPWRRRVPDSPPTHDQFPATLPSSAPGLEFTALFQVSWVLLMSTAHQQHPQSVACDLVLDVAHQALTKAPFGINDLVPAEHRVNAALGRLHPQAHPEVRILTARVTLSVPRDVQAIADEHARLEREQMLADLVQARELARLRRFQATVLRDPGTALSYRYMQDPSQDLTKLLDAPFDDLVQRVGTYDPSKGWVQVAKLLTEVVSRLDQQHIEHLVWVLCEIVSRAGHPEKRDAIRRYLMEDG
ncbi:hypothetical protein [Micromonospora humida]|uniref:hypothetical protein n=1 Tax=Micromonospora humida TaxID=2809018 RepID=UPI00343AE6E6